MESANSKDKIKKGRRGGASARRLRKSSRAGSAALATGVFVFEKRRGHLCGEKEGVLAFEKACWRDGRVVVRVGSAPPRWLRKQTRAGSVKPNEGVGYTTKRVSE